MTGRRAKDDKEDKGFSDEQRVRREEREIEKGSWSSEREREWEEERARIGGSTAQCWGGQRCRHRKPLLLQATEDGRQREREREDGEREAPSISEASPTRGRGLKSTTADGGRRS